MYNHKDNLRGMKWQPHFMLLPESPRDGGGLMGRHLWGRTEQQQEDES